MDEAWLPTIFARLVRQGDGAGLVMNKLPVSFNLAEMVAGRERHRPDLLDAQNPPLIAADDRIGVMTGDGGAMLAAEYIPPAANHRLSPDDGRPAGVNAGNRVIICPKASHAREVPDPESRVEGRVGGQK